MRTVIINTNWEYKTESGIIVNAKEHFNLRSMLTAAMLTGKKIEDYYKFYYYAYRIWGELPHGKSIELARKDTKELKDRLNRKQ